jgi:hypothetical protein
MTRLGRPWPLGIVASSLALALAIVLGAHGPVRGVLTLWFFLTCPGMAIVGLLDIDDRLAETVIAIGLSVAIGMLLGLVMMLTHTWSADAATAILLSLSVTGAGAQARIGARAR